MENTTMTNATQMSRVRFACPQVATGHLVADTWGRIQVTTVSAGIAFGIEGVFAVTALGVDGGSAPALYAPSPKTLAKDVVHLRSGRPPV